MGVPTRDQQKHKWSGDVEVWQRQFVGGRKPLLLQRTLHALGYHFASRSTLHQLGQVGSPDVFELAAQAWEPESTPTTEEHLVFEKRCIFEKTNSARAKLVQTYETGLDRTALVQENKKAALQSKGEWPKRTAKEASSNASNTTLHKRDTSPTTSLLQRGCV